MNKSVKLYDFWHIGYSLSLKRSGKEMVLTLQLFCQLLFARGRYKAE